jgi:outer membrane protein assembly factor BamB
MRSMLDSRFWMAAALALVTASAAARAQTQPAGGWLEGWRFREAVLVEAAAGSGDVTIEHNGLAQPDGRDVRIVGPDGSVRSQFISFADARRVRVVFDASGGRGRYLVYFGNNAADLPATPEGVWPLGDPQWRPKGGYTSVSFDPMQPTVRDKLSTLQAVQAAFEQGLQRAREANEAEESKEPRQRRPFVLETRVRSTAGSLMVPGVQNHWLHRVTVRFRIDQPGNYSIVMGDGRESDQLGVVVLDGNTANPVVSGWYAPGSIFGQVYGTIGTAELSAGPHTFDLYTSRRNPDIRIGPASGERPPVHMDGMMAHFDDATVLAPGELETSDTSLAAAYLAAVKENVSLGRFASARTLARVAQERFAGDPLLPEFATIADAAEGAAYDRNWLTEGKYPSRTGYVADADFAPPLVLASMAQENLAHDQRHISSAAWVEGRLMYGLPYDTQQLPWGVTSGISVADDVLYVGTKNGVMHAISLITGSPLWTFPGGGSSLGTPLVYRGRLYYGSIDRRLYALDLLQGRMVWNYPPRGWIDGSPAAAEGRVFFGSRDGVLYAIDAELGVARWEQKLGSPIVGTPAVSDGKVFIGTRGGKFVAASAGDGAIAWTYDAGAAIEGGSCVGAGRVVFGDAKGRIHALDIATGQPAWPPREVGGPVVASPILVESTVWGGTTNGKLFAVDLASGEVVWTLDSPDRGAVTRPPLFCDGTLVFVTSRREFQQPDGNWNHVGGATLSFKMQPKPAQ